MQNRLRGQSVNLLILEGSLKITTLNDMGKLFLASFILLFVIMGKVVSTNIRDNYLLYTDLRQNRKSGADKNIDLSTPKPNNKNFLTNKKTLLKHITRPEEIVFISEVKVRDYKFFHFKVRCGSLFEIPFFRYDSDGPTHRNYDESIPFADQQVTTPHFHEFNSDGISIAYKTAKLLNDKERKALEDINLCAAHFYHEGNIRVGTDDFPTITILSNTLQLPHKEDDPNAGVNFL